jgi:hypothetical protein
MNNIDIEISEKVAEEAGKQMQQLKREIESNKTAHISLLEDILSDVKEQRKFLKFISISLFILLLVVIIGSFGLSLVNQKFLKDCTVQNTEKMLDFISNTDFNSNVEMITDNNSENNGNLSITK